MAISSFSTLLVLLQHYSNFFQSIQKQAVVQDPTEAIIDPNLGA
jgi:hypothetical protein